MKIGTIRKLLLIKGEHLWNSWIRDITAKLEEIGFLESK